MRIVLQRVSRASVTVDEVITGEIGLGLLILLGVVQADNQDDIDWLVRKVSQMRIFNDSSGKMNSSLMDVKGEILLVSQFTLHASTRKGNRPSFIRAAKPDFAEQMYTQFKNSMEEFVGTTIQTGIFGAMMQVELVNDGPVTITIDSKNRE
jgi:D-tyrosyl-tRNA(Tyr) deacylase